MRITPRWSVALAVLLFPLAAAATPVAYEFSGNLTGILETAAPDSPQTMTSVPFQVAIFGDTDAASFIGFQTGSGPTWMNNSGYASWTVSGLGSATTNTAEVYTGARTGRIFLDWGGQAFPAPGTGTGTDGTILTFFGFGINLAPYLRLDSLVDPTDVALRTLLQDPTNEFNSAFALYFNNSQTLHVQDLTNVTYSVVPVPLSSTDLLLLSGVAGLILTELLRRRGLSAPGADGYAGRGGSTAGPAPVSC